MSRTATRAFTVADLEAVSALEQRLFSHPLARRSLENMLSAGHVGFVADSDQGVCGYVIARAAGGEADLLTIAVSEQAQGSGVAGQLLKALVAALSCCGVDKLFLEVRASNHRAIRFYRKWGFSDFGRRRSYYPACNGAREDAQLFGLLIESGEQGENPFYSVTNQGLLEVE